LKKKSGACPGIYIDFHIFTQLIFFSIFIEFFTKCNQISLKSTRASDPKSNLTLHIPLYRTSKLQRGIKYWVEEGGERDHLKGEVRVDQSENSPTVLVSNSG